MVVMPRANFFRCTGLCDFVDTFEVDFFQFWLQFAIGSSALKYYVGAAVLNIVLIAAVMGAHAGFLWWKAVDGVAVVRASTGRLCTVLQSNRILALAATLRSSILHNSSSKAGDTAASKSDGAAGTAPLPAHPTADAAPASAPVPGGPGSAVTAWMLLLRFAKRSSIPCMEWFLVVLFWQVTVRSTFTLFLHGEYETWASGVVYFVWCTLLVWLFAALVVAFPLAWDGERDVIKTTNDWIFHGNGAWVENLEEAVNQRKVVESTSTSSSDSSSQESESQERQSTASRANDEKDGKNDETTAIEPNNVTPLVNEAEPAATLEQSPAAEMGTAAPPLEPITGLSDVLGLQDTSTFVAKYRPLYFIYRDSCQWFLLVELVFSAAMGGLEAVRPEDGCSTIAAVAMGIGLLYAGLFAWLRPCTAPIDLVVFGCGAVAFVLAPLFQLVFHETDMAWAEVMGTFVTVTWMLLMDARFVVIVHEGYVRFREARIAKKRKKAKCASAINIKEDLRLQSLQWQPSRDTTASSTNSPPRYFRKGLLHIPFDERLPRVDAAIQPRSVQRKVHEEDRRLLTLLRQLEGRGEESVAPLSNPLLNVDSGERTSPLDEVVSRRSLDATFSSLPSDQYAAVMRGEEQDGPPRRVQQTACTVS